MRASCIQDVKYRTTQGQSKASPAGTDGLLQSENHKSGCVIPETETNSEFTPENGWLECEDLMVTLKYLDIFYIFLAVSLFAQELNICFHIKIL